MTKVKVTQGFGTNRQRECDNHVSDQ